jgi:hypothetical protein
MSPKFQLVEEFRTRTGRTVGRYRDSYRKRRFSNSAFQADTACIISPFAKGSGSGVLFAHPGCDGRFPVLILSGR